MTREQRQELLAKRAHQRRLMRREEMANVAVFMASDNVSGITGTLVNLTMGSLDDQPRISATMPPGSAGADNALIRPCGV